MDLATALFFWFFIALLFAVLLTVVVVPSILDFHDWLLHRKKRSWYRTWH